MLRKMVLSLLFASFLSATPQAVVFDWGNVLANPDPKPILAFLCESFGVFPEEIENANAEKQKNQIPEIEFWLQFAKKRNIALPEDWLQRYKEISRVSLNVDQEMYDLVDELKAKGIPVALLSNIKKRYADLIRYFGLYDPFQPCLLSGETGIEKPDPRAFEQLLNELALPASDVVFIDDKSQNIEAAQQLGIDAILFKSHTQLRKILTQKGLL